MELIAKKLSKANDTSYYHTLSEQVRQSFIEEFYQPSETYLFDTVDKDKHDSALRPNQLLAASLDFTMLSAYLRERVVQRIGRTY